MKTSIMKSLKKFGSMALVTALLMSTVAVAGVSAEDVSADSEESTVESAEDAEQESSEEAPAEEAESSEEAPVEEEVTDESSAEAESSEEAPAEEAESSEEVPAEETEEAPVEEEETETEEYTVKPATYVLAYVGDTLSDVLSALQSMASGNVESPDQVTDMATKLKGYLLDAMKNLNSAANSFTSESLGNITTELGNAQSTMQNVAQSGSFGKSSVQSANSAVRQAIEAANQLKGDIDTAQAQKTIDDENAKPKATEAPTAEPTAEPTAAPTEAPAADGTATPAPSGTVINNNNTVVVNPTAAPSSSSSSESSKEEESGGGFLDTINKILDTVKKGAGTATDIAGAIGKFKELFPGAKTAEDLTKQLGSKLADAGLDVGKDVLGKIAETVMGSGSDSSDSGSGSGSSSSGGTSNNNSYNTTTNNITINNYYGTDGKNSDSSGNSSEGNDSEAITASDAVNEILGKVKEGWTADEDGLGCSKIEDGKKKSVRFQPNGETKRVKGNFVRKRFDTESEAKAYALQHLMDYSIEPAVVHEKNKDVEWWDVFTFGISTACRYYNGHDVTYYDAIGWLYDDVAMGTLQETESDDLTGVPNLKDADPTVNTSK